MKLHSFIIIVIIIIVIIIALVLTATSSYFGCYRFVFGFTIFFLFLAFL